MFDVAAEAYDAFMGRYSTPLAPRFCDFAGIGSERRVLDVGCGPGALITELVGRLGSAGVSAVDPSHSFVQAVRERHPDVDVRQASAEQLPFHEDEFDASLAQLVVHFMDDPFAGWTTGRWKSWWSTVPARTAASRWRGAMPLRRSPSMRSISAR